MAVVGRKAFSLSGSYWAALLAVRMYSIIGTLKRWGVNRHKWFIEYLHACACNGGAPPEDVTRFLPWKMDEERRKSLSDEPDKLPPALKAKQKKEKLKHYLDEIGNKKDQCAEPDHLN